MITQLEPELFKKVTGLEVKDFELLVSLNVFNEALMNDAVYKFKRYEDASLSYTGIDRHADQGVGLYSTVVSREDYNKMTKKPIPTESTSEPKATPLSTTDEAKEKEPAVPHSTVQTSTDAAHGPTTASPPSNDISKVTPGVKVTHKAFGEGTVTGVEKGIITVSFGDMSKKFQFPGAFQQGFLHI